MDPTITPAVPGCTDSTATNYDPSATLDDGSCIATVNGCTDSLATNYNMLANTDDGSCVYPPLNITVTVCDTSASSVRLPGPCGGDGTQVEAPVATSNGNGTWTFTFSPAPPRQIWNTC